MAATMEEQILRAAKEIAVKFIETGRVSPTNFPEHFRTIYNGITDVVLPEDEEDGGAPEVAAPVKGNKKKKG